MCKNIYFWHNFFLNSQDQDANFELFKTPLGAQMNILYSKTFLENFQKIFKKFADQEVRTGQESGDRSF